MTTQFSEISSVLTENSPEELLKILMSWTTDGTVLKHFPLMFPTVGMSQDKRFHPDTVYVHCAKTCVLTPPVETLRWAGFLHDIGKGYTRKEMPHAERSRITFYKHDVVGEAKARELLLSLNAPQETVDEICFLVRNHMYHYVSDTWALFKNEKELPKTRCGSVEDCQSLPDYVEGLDIKKVLPGWKDSTVIRFAKKAGIEVVGGRVDMENTPLFILRGADRGSRGFDRYTKKQVQLEERIQRLLLEGLNTD